MSGEAGSVDGRCPFFGANWKMNGSGIEGLSWLGALQSAGSDGSLSDLDIALFPPFTLLPVLSEAAREAGAALGSQDLFYESRGAFTGEISAGMLVEAGCSWAIVGHSERRHILGESHDTVARKLRAALGSGLGVVLCVGETLPEREAGMEKAVVEEMLGSALAGIADPDPAVIVVAYEPVWAIGTGRNATPEQASAMHGHVRGVLARLHPGPFAGSCRIIYGGSVNPGNAGSILAMPDVDGALVGGASLDAGSFLGIIESRRHTSG